MNDFLASVYGTNDMEKTAENELVEYLEGQGVDIESLSDEQITEIAESFVSGQEEDTTEGEQGFSDEDIQAFDAALRENDIDPASLSEEEVNGYAEQFFGGEEAGEAGEVTDEAGEEKEAMAKVAEIDFLGRVMAHSFWDESGEIQKTAGKASAFFKKPLQSFKKSYSSLRKGSFQKDGEGKGKLKAALQAAGRTVKKHPQTAGVPAAAILAGGGGAAMAKKSFDEAFEQEAFARAQAYEQDLLKSAAAEGDLTDEQLSALVDERALQMLAEAGYEVE